MMEWPGTERIQHPRDAEEIADLVKEVNGLRDQLRDQQNGRPPLPRPTPLPRPVIDQKPAETVSSMIDLAHTRFIVTAWPDHRWPLEIMRWMEGLMENVTPARKDYRSSVKVKNVECARNHAIKFDALRSDKSYEWFVFLDRDVRPRQGDTTTKFLRLTEDVKCCQVEHGTDTAYAWPDDFHEPIWCTSRDVLEAIKPPWFVQHYNEDHTEMVGCICKSFREKVLDAGFTIAHGGRADHDREGSWCG